MTGETLALSDQLKPMKILDQEKTTQAVTVSQAVVVDVQSDEEVEEDNNSQFGFGKRLTNERIKNLVLVSKMKNLRRLALVTGVAALSAVAFSPKAQAQTTNVDFSGTVPATCAINSTTTGTLNYFNTKTLLADSMNGTRGTINVTCNNGTTFTITGITNNGSVITGGTYAANIDAITATISDGNTFWFESAVSPNSSVSIPSTAVINVPSPAQTGPITGKNYNVGLVVTNTTNPLKLGTYNVRVAVSLTPQ